MGTSTRRGLATLLGGLVAGACGGEPDADACETDDCGTEGTGGSSSASVTATATTPGTSAGTTSTTSTTSTTTDPSAEESEASGNPVGDWWDCAWSNRTTLTVLGPPGEEELEAFAVPLVPSEAWFEIGAASSDGRDLRFVDGEGNVLPHEVESWADGDGRVAWFRVPTIPAQGEGVAIDVYYGNPDADDEQAPAEVWSSYARVWHLSGAREDAASGAALEGQASSAAGILGGAEAFGEVDDALFESRGGIGGDLFGSGATISAWINPTGYGGSGFGRICALASGFNAEQGWTWLLAENVDGIGFIRGHDGNAGFWTYADSVPLDTWTHVAVAYDDGDSLSPPLMYAGGVELVPFEVGTPSGAVQSGAPEPLTIGEVAFEGETRQFAGAIDELRIRDGLSSRRWLAAERASAQGTMVVAVGSATAPVDCAE